MLIDLTKIEKIKTEEDIKSEEDRVFAIDYLKSTDWYVIRKFETGSEIPIEVSNSRNKSREVLRKHQ